MMLDFFTNKRGFYICFWHPTELRGFGAQIRRRWLSVLLHAQCRRLRFGSKGGVCTVKERESVWHGPCLSSGGYRSHTPRTEVVQEVATVVLFRFGRMQRTRYPGNGDVSSTGVLTGTASPERKSGTMMP